MHESHYGRGKLEGEAIGEAKGKAETLLQMIKRKFNQSLSKEDEIRLISQIQQAGVKQLTQWVDGVFDAVTLKDLFALFDGESDE